MPADQAPRRRLLTSRPARITVAVLASLVGAVLGYVAITSVLDARELAEVRASVHANALPRGEELAAARAALARLAALDSAPVWMHAWLHTLGRHARAETFRAVEHALAHAATLTRAREANAAWLARLIADMQQAQTIAGVEAVQQAMFAGGPHPEAPLPISPLAALQRQADDIIAQYEADDARNARAIADARTRLAAAAARPSELQAVAHAVLPAPDRRAPARALELDALRAAADHERTRLLAHRVRAIEQHAEGAFSAAQVEVQLIALDRDPDLRAGVPASLGVPLSRSRIAARMERLATWERGRRQLEACLRDADVAGAAHALAALEPPDDHRAQELAQLRAGFGVRAAAAFARGLAHAAEHGDWPAIRRLIAAFETDGAVRGALDAQSTRDMERAAGAARQAEERARPTPGRPVH